eukprot:1155125-Pelagomonas_calceolata.AAC.8
MGSSQVASFIPKASSSLDDTSVACNMGEPGCLTLNSKSDLGRAWCQVSHAVCKNEEEPPQQILSKLSLQSSRG